MDRQLYTADVVERISSLQGLLTVLAYALSQHDSNRAAQNAVGVEGAEQTVRRTLILLDEKLDYFREMCL